MIFTASDFDNHEKVLFCTDTRTNLKAIIAIHSSRLGAAAGGCRMYPYASEREALDDVLRLSRAMTYKNALAGLKLGGGKSVIIGDPAELGASDRLAAFGRCVEALGGAYWTAEDVGVNVDALEHVARTTRYVFGTKSRKGATGDPSAFTARGVFAGLRAAVRHRLGRENILGLRVAVQGVGAVGWELCSLLHNHGAKLVVADHNSGATERARRAFNAQVCASERVHAADVDVLAPCALGGTLNERTILEITATVVAGAANNSLKNAAAGAELRRRGILYAPDFVINAGGMMHASAEIFGSHDTAAVTRAIDGIYETVIRVCSRAQAENTLPELVAQQLAIESLLHAEN